MDFWRPPEKISGRTVTNRGVHLAPYGFQPWMEREDYWLRLLTDMGMSWVVLLTESDACIKSGAVEALLGAGIIPIIRFAYQLPRPWTEGDTVRALVRIYRRYDLEPPIIFANEPFDSREWVDGKVPEYHTAWRVIGRRWEEMARETLNAGAIPCFPDGPCYSYNPFIMTIESRWIWDTGRALYATHNYGKGRPLDYPYDIVNQATPEDFATGKAILTEGQYVAALDDYADDPDWNELINNPNALFMINEQRRLWARPGMTIADDDTCFLGWMKVQQWSLEALGYEVPMLMTEGGWVPRDRAGGNPTDIRWPYTTPRMVARKTLAMYKYNSPLLAVCPWLLADSDMGGSGWPFDAWHGWAYSDKYGSKKPVIDMLISNPPKIQCDGLERVHGMLCDAMDILKGAL